jgi:threonine/homoserine/homoserine lactone efflux protein
MNSTLLVSLTGFAFISALTPGPNNLLLMSSGALFGWQRSLPHLGGILLGFAILMSSAVFGLGSVVAQWPWLVTIVRILGAAWLAWMSLRYFLAGLRGPATDTDSSPAPISRPFRFHEGVLFQWVNPKALILVISAAGAYIAIAESIVQRMLIIVGIFFVAGSRFLLYLDDCGRCLEPVSVVGRVCQIRQPRHGNPYIADRATHLAGLMDR